MVTRYCLLEWKNKKSSYGVKITKERIVEDISNNKEMVIKLVQTCNKTQLDFDQFDDVLENYLEDFETF